MFAYGYLHGTLSKTLFWRRVCLGRNSNFCLSYEILLDIISQHGFLHGTLSKPFSGRCMFGEKLKLFLSCEILLELFPNIPFHSKLKPLFQ
jgi:hypothetical protein